MSQESVQLEAMNQVTGQQGWGGRQARDEQFIFQKWATVKWSGDSWLAQSLTRKHVLPGAEGRGHPGLDFYCALPPNPSIKKKGGGLCL